MDLWVRAEIPVGVAGIAPCSAAAVQVRDDIARFQIILGTLEPT
jgi:hypothetical protein